MKKKLLSLVLAGAMVASTSVSAFADSTKTQEITSFSDGSNTANVEIKGFVDDNQGVAPSGTISVSIPTSLQFQVSKDGDLTGTNINVVNNGLDQVEIVADQFTDDTPNGSITVNVPKDFERASKKRSEIVLWIQGNAAERAYFKSDESNKNGIYNAEGENQTGGVTISKLSGKNGSSNSDELQLKGYAGTTRLDDSNTISDQFTLRLKVKKVTP